MRRHGKHLFGTLIVSLLIVAPGWAASAAPELIVPISVGVSPAAAQALDAEFYAYRVFELPHATIAQRVHDHGGVTMHLGYRTFELELELNDLRAPRHRVILMSKDGPVELEPIPADTYRGHVRGESGSIVRLTVRSDHFEGYIRTEEAWLHVDPLTWYDTQAAPDHVVVYRGQDVRPKVGERIDEAPVHGLRPKLLTDLQPRVTTGQAASRTYTIEVANEGDGGFVQRHGPFGAQSRINTVTNSVDGIYESELGLNISIVFTLLWPDPSVEPYTTDWPLTRMDEFQGYWNANFAWVSRDATLQYTDNLTQIFGLARDWGTICLDPESSYAIVEDQTNLKQVARLTAHEIGHLFDVYHPDQVPICPSVNCSGNGDPIMCGGLTLPTNGFFFSDCTKETVADWVAMHGSCL